MLQLKNIQKTYITGDLQQRALAGIDLTFRRSEFVAVCGVSGSGKTTLLNLIGGLDQYDEGDLLINGISTRKYRDSDWDAYRNHAVGFVFQSYNLIPHQSVLANVELALTLSGVSKAERKKQAADMLAKVGLDDQLHKRPGQLSGGQMQRVAIARALLNNPDILLADEPTGALDTETSVQIMDLLKEIAKDRLVIMVTHNPEIANTYATRIIQLRDGKIISDSNPVDTSAQGEPSAPIPGTARDNERGLAKTHATPGVGGKTSMSFWTAISLSLNNLMTKKTRTLLTSFAGSIGIIGIALILALQSGVQAFISRVEEDTLSTYPISIESQTMDTSGVVNIMQGSMEGRDQHELDAVYENRMMLDLFSLMTAQIEQNDLAAFKAFLESGKSGIDQYINAIQYNYSLTPQIFKSDTSSGVVQVNPGSMLSSMRNMRSQSSGQEDGASSLSSQFSGMSSMGGMGGMSMMSMGGQVFQEMLDNEALLASQYDVLAGRWPTAYDEIVLLVDGDNEINDVILYSLGLKDASELTQMMMRAMSGEAVEFAEPPLKFSYDELLSLTYKLVLNTDYYQKSGDHWVDRRNDTAYMKALLESALELKIVGILRPNSEAIAASIMGTVGYLPELTEYIIDAVAQSEIAREQLASPDIDVISGLPFPTAAEAEETRQTTDTGSLTDTQRSFISALPSGQIDSYRSSTQYSSSTYEDILQKLGYVDPDTPTMISIYPVDFSAKESIAKIIDDYNLALVAEGKESHAITYTDIIGLLMSSVTTIVNAVSYVLIAFVAISLVVSSIMIGVITYISVLERTKEIGILRSVGASKKDISRVFNAETLIVGLGAGLLGVGITLALSIPINAIILSLTGISNVAALPMNGAIILVLLSVLLTVIAGLIPSRIAARKDPVAALRSE